MTTARRSTWTPPEARVVVKCDDGEWEAGVCVWCGAVIFSRELDVAWAQRAPTGKELDRLERVVGPALAAARRMAAQLRDRLAGGEGAPMA